MLFAGTIGSRRSLWEGEVVGSYFPVNPSGIAALFLPLKLFYSMVSLLSFRIHHTPTNFSPK